MVVVRRAVFVAGFILSLSPSARAALRIKWDCYLPNTNLDCAVLQSSLTSKIPFVTVVSRESDADVFVEVKSIPAEDATRVRLNFRGRPNDGYVTSVQANDKIPMTIDATTALVRVMTKLERGLALFMDQKKAAGAENGKLDLVLSDPTDLPFRGRPEQTAKKWYIAPALGSYFSDVVGVGINASGTASVSFNESHSKWRLQQVIGASYLQESQPVPSTPDTATVSFLSGWANNVLSHDITSDHRFGVAVLLGAEKNPQANYRMRANASIGLEFDLVPRQTANMRNFGVRCAVGPEYQHYDATNIEGLDQQIVPRELCDVYFSWHFKPIDLSASVSENVVLKSADYTSFSASLGATWRVTDNFLISPWVAIQDIVKAIDEAQPTNAVYTDPKSEIEASMRAAVQQGYTAPFGVQSGLTIKYVFGNGSLASEDQRWKNVTSLR